MKIEKMILSSPIKIELTGEEAVTLMVLTGRYNYHDMEKNCGQHYDRVRALTSLIYDWLDQNGYKIKD